MNVALLDSGISCKGVLNKKIVEIREFYSKKMLKANNEYFMPVHGTICAEIISNICSNVQFFDLRVLDKDGTTKIEVLIEALDWCIQNRLKLMHMSIGTINYFDSKLLEIKIAELINQDAIIVAAYHNSNIKTYPAALPGVFGVRQDYYGILKNNQFIFQKQKGAKSENSIVAHWSDEKGRNLANSYAAPVVTGHIANFLNTRPAATFQEVLQFLEERAIQGKIYPDMLGNVVRKDENVEIPVIAGMGLPNGIMQNLTEQFKTSEYQVLLLQWKLRQSIFERCSCFRI